MRVAAEWDAKQHIVGKLFQMDTDNLLCDCGARQPVCHNMYHSRRYYSATIIELLDAAVDILE